MTITGSRVAVTALGVRLITSLFTVAVALAARDTDHWVCDLTGPGVRPRSPRCLVAPVRALRLRPRFRRFAQAPVGKGPALTTH